MSLGQPTMGRVDEAVALATNLHGIYQLPAPQSMDVWWAWYANRIRSRFSPDLLNAFAYVEAQGESIESNLMGDCARAWALLKWHDSGMPVFEPTQGLAAAVTLTKFGKTLLGEIALPFESVAIRLPRPWLPKPFDDLAIIWLYKILAPDGTLAIRVEVASDKTDIGYHSAAPLNQLVEAWIESRSPRDGSLPMGDEEWAVLRICTRLALGVAVYISSMTPESRKAARVGKKHPPVRVEPHAPIAFEHPTVWSIGHDIKLPKELRQAAVSFTTSRGAGRKDWRVAKRFAVRGHFRWTLIGLRVEAHHEWRWVKPYWKGPESGMSIRRTYKVDEGTEHGRG